MLNEFQISRGMAVTKVVALDGGKTCWCTVLEPVVCAIAANWYVKLTFICRATFFLRSAWMTCISYSLRSLCVHEQEEFIYALRFSKFLAEQTDVQL